MKANTINIEALLAKKEQISNKALQSALTKLEEQRSAEQEAALLRHLEIVQGITKNAVESLRNRRAQEKIAKDYLLAVATAEQEFYKNADVAAYNAAIHAASKVVGKISLG